MSSDITTIIPAAVLERQELATHLEELRQEALLKVDELRASIENGELFGFGWVGLGYSSAREVEPVVMQTCWTEGATYAGYAAISGADTLRRRMQTYLDDLVEEITSSEGGS